MTLLQLVPFDLAPQAHNVHAAMLRCQEAVDAAMSEHKRATTSVDELKRQLDDAETTIGDLRIGEEVFFFFFFFFFSSFRAFRKSIVAQRVDEFIKHCNRE
jgi:hypothetical protein